MMCARAHFTLPFTTHTRIRFRCSRIPQFDIKGIYTTNWSPGRMGGSEGERYYIIVLYSADVGRILYINGYYFIFLAYTNVCSVTELT